MRREFSSQPALFAGPAFEDHPALHALDGLESVIDWTALEPLLPQGEGRTGRPGYPAQTLFRALLLGLTHNLSDVKLEAQLARDLAFRRFCRLEIDQGTPQASTLGRFRAALEREGRLETVLGEVNRQLAATGVIIETGRITIVDATVVEAARSGPEGKGAGPDPDGGMHAKEDARGRKRYTWGFRGFVACDEDQFIHAAEMRPGNAGEIHELPRLVSRAGGAAVYADSAYSSAAMRAHLAAHGIADHVQRKGYRGHPLGAADKHRNAAIASVRSLIEPIFGTLKAQFGLRRTRLLGLGPNRCQWLLAAIGWNLAKGARFRAAYG